MKYGTLLVIDDNPSILTALKICLGNTFERILTLPRPDTAPTLLQQEQVDLILLDMNFSLGVNSGQDGLLWLRTFRRLHAHIPVVLITAFADVQLAIKGLKSGAADFVTKPWDNDELIRTLKDAIDLYKKVMETYPQLHLIASGGVSCNEDILALEAAGIPAVVFGKAFYEGKINIEKLVVSD